MNQPDVSPSNSTDYLKRAWIWLVLILAGQLAGQLTGHLISSALGHGEETAFYGLKVVKQGKKIGYFHVYVGGLFSLLMVVIFVLTSFGVGQ